MQETVKRQLIQYLKQYITKNKREQFDRLIGERTRHLTVVLENIHKPHNASAVVRTCDCLGIQDIHVIEENSAFEYNKDVLQGSGKWVNIERYENRKSALHKLRENGYRVVATSPRTGSIPLDQLPLKQKLALAFGAELKGLSDEMLEEADLLTHIPMFGFTESFNISVSAAICLHSLTERLRASDVPWKFSAEERDDVYLFWLRQVHHRSDFLIEKFMKEATE